MQDAITKDPTPRARARARSQAACVVGVQDVEGFLARLASLEANDGYADWRRVSLII
jgi:hypothetical protein